MRILLAAVFIALFVTPAFAGDSWVAFRDPDTAFTVDLPGTPTVKSDSTKAGDGSDIPILSYVIDRGTAAMLVMIGDFTKQDVDPGKAIDAGVAALQADGRTLQSNVLDQLDGEVGRSVMLTDTEGDNYSDRVFFVRKKLYQVMTVIPANASDEQKADAARFSASFHFTAR
jgi:hypothetical protein